MKFEEYFCTVYESVDIIENVTLQTDLFLHYL